MRPDDAPSAVRFLLATRPGPPGQLGRLVSAGRIVGGRGVPDAAPRAIDTFALMLVSSGTGVYRDRAGERPLGPGSAVVVVPGHRHWYGALSRGGWDEVYLTFEGPAFGAALSAGLVSAVEPVRPLQPVPYWLDRVDGFRTRRPPTTLSGADHEVCDLLRLLVEVHSGVGSGTGFVQTPGPARGGWLHRSESLLAQNLGESLALAHVAAAVGIGYESWRKQFQAETGVSPGRYRLLRRVDAAAEALRRSTLTHREIAASLGFTDEHHFSKQFLRIRGVAPSAFRRGQG